MNTEIAKLLLSALAGEPKSYTHEKPQAEASPWQIGKTYVIRTVTMIQLGRLVAVYPQELVLEDASWIADTGRFANFLKDPELRFESEPFCAPCIVGRGAIVDAQVVKDVVLAQK